MFRSFPILSVRWIRLFCIGIGSVLAGLVAAIVSLNFYNAQSIRQNGSAATMLHDGWLFYATAALASLLVGPCFWWYFVLRPNRLTLFRSILVGIVGSIAVHPLTWLFADLTAYFIGKQTVGGLFLVDFPLLALVGAPFYAVFSLLCVGWITILIGGGTGGVLFCAQRTCDRRQFVGQ